MARAVASSDNGGVFQRMAPDESRIASTSNVPAGLGWTSIATRSKHQECARLLRTARTARSHLILASGAASCSTDGSSGVMTLQLALFRPALGPPPSE